MATKVFPKVVHVVHTVFEGFDVYVVEFGYEKANEKLLFHKPKAKGKIFGDVFQFLGAHENLWLCRNICDDSYAVSPFYRFIEATMV